MNLLHQILGLVQHQQAPARRVQEDDGLVNYQGRQVPLSSLPVGSQGQWTPVQQEPIAQFGINQIHQLLGAANNPQANQLGGDFGTPIQGVQNPGYIPAQGSQGVSNIQSPDMVQGLPNRNARITW